MAIQILKKTSLFLCAGALIIFSSCNNNEAGTVGSDEGSETVKDAPRALINDDSSKKGTMDGVEVEAKEPNTPINMNTGSNGGSITLNPPHGEPGHDCAVKVGDPLPSSSKNLAPSNNGAPINNSPMNSPVKLNPPHGEPGHDCAVKVGAPLN
ncbi:hypothetical protein [Brumimicrobium oceani]|uniref:Secreted protein n=1 Tax=Brumimicrobium oceani TaxID=2100725 RepID=A0A2U2X1C4_9FLAO|nr:hypothetical protein [Brumimicrobium oceani]PWH81554.1 hypothetical protein DIT68_14595 [Brumimicrobium oceani]